MTSTDVGKQRNRGRGTQDLPRYDQALRAAKNAGKPVLLILALETAYTNAEGEVQGAVLEVDKFSIQILCSESGRKPWIAKSMIVSAEVLS